MSRALCVSEYNRITGLSNAADLSEGKWSQMKQAHQRRWMKWQPGDTMEAVEIDSDEQIPYAPTCYKYKHVNVQKSTQINIYHASTFCHTAAREDLNRVWEREVFPMLWTHCPYCNYQLGKTGHLVLSWPFSSPLMSFPVTLRLRLGWPFTDST